MYSVAAGSIYYMCILRRPGAELHPSGYW
jgi:hypothetical protein